MAKEFKNKEVSRFLEAWFGARQLIQAANFNRFQKAGLSATQFMTLNLLPAKNARLTLGELAKKMNLSPATVTKTIDSLEARGLLMRSRSEADGRLVLIALTKRGRHFQNAASAEFHGHMSRLFEAMGPRQRSGLIEGLEAMIRIAHGGTEPKRSQATGARGGGPRAKRNSPSLRKR